MNRFSVSLIIEREISAANGANITSQYCLGSALNFFQHVSGAAFG
ncbi:MAG: hypothetical protein OFPI_17500 [Osedax symbiont Rs2]|nr:MAG: hypothetical protein OFPI_17500 [Osedax symbiont Rs2]